MHLAKRGAFALMILIAFALSAAAQAPPPYLSISHVTIKPDRVGEWLDIQKQYSAAYKKGGGSWLLVYRTTLGNPYEFMVVTPLENYAQRDGESFVSKGMSQGDLVRLNMRRNQVTESVRVTVDKPIAELSYMKAGASPPKMMRVNHTRVRPGMGDQYIVLMKELVAGFQKIGVAGFRARRVDLGGSRNDFYSAIPMDKWAELDGPSLSIKALGENGYKTWAEKLYQTIAFSEYFIYSLVTDVSILPAQ
jgi:hypothetical protein